MSISVSFLITSTVNASINGYGDKIIGPIGNWNPFYSCLFRNYFVFSYYTIERAEL